MKEEIERAREYNNKRKINKKRIKETENRERMNEKQVKKEWKSQKERKK